MNIGDQVEWDGQVCTITHIEDRNTYEPLQGVRLHGQVVVLENLDGKKFEVYDFDLY